MEADKLAVLIVKSVGSELSARAVGREKSDLRDVLT